MYSSINLVKKNIKDNPSFDIKKSIIRYFCTLGKLLKQVNYKYIIVLFIPTGLDIFSRQIHYDRLLELQNMQNIYDKIKQLQKNKLVYKKLQTSSVQFIKYIETVFENKYAKILDIKVDEPENFNNYRETKVEITGVFIHDKFIFETLDELYSYEGLICVKGIKIGKHQLHNGVNVLNTVIVCELYTK